MTASASTFEATETTAVHVGIKYVLCYLVTGRDDRRTGAILGHSGIKQGLQNQLQRA